MQRIQILVTALLMMFAATGHAALTAYAELYISGESLDGDVTLGSIGGVNVSSGHIEIYEIDQSLFVKGKSGPILLQKRIDQTTPLLIKAMTEQLVVEGDIKIFDNDPDSGETRHRFTISLMNAMTVESNIRVPDAFDASQSNTPPTEYVQIEVEGYSVTDVINGNSYMVNF